MQALRAYLQDIETRLKLQPMAATTKYIYQYSLYLQKELEERGDKLGKFVSSSSSYINCTFYNVYSCNNICVPEIMEGNEEGAKR